MLSIQYRMNELICLASSEHFYGGQLVAHPSNQKLVLATSEYMQRATISKSSILDANCPIMWINHTCPEQQETRGSKNPEEINIVLRLLEELLFNFKIPIDKIGVITPYNAQKSLFFQILKNAVGGPLKTLKLLEVSTVDSYQGREKDVIIMMATKSGSSNVGFLSEERRMNVSMTRARRLFIMVGNSSTLIADRSKMPFTRHYYDKVLAHGHIFQFNQISRTLSRSSPPFSPESTLSTYIFKGDKVPFRFPALRYRLEQSTTVPDYSRSNDLRWKDAYHVVTVSTDRGSGDRGRQGQRADWNTGEDATLLSMMGAMNVDPPRWQPQDDYSALTTLSKGPHLPTLSGNVLEAVAQKPQQTHFVGGGIAIGGSQAPPPRLPPAVVSKQTLDSLERMFPGIEDGEEVAIFGSKAATLERLLVGRTALEVDLHRDAALSSDADFVEAFIMYRSRMEFLHETSLTVVSPVPNRSGQHDSVMHLDEDSVLTLPQPHAFVVPCPPCAFFQCVPSAQYGFDS